jgi:hypothetical protein
MYSRSCGLIKKVKVMRFLEGLGHQMDIFSAFNIKSVIFVTCANCVTIFSLPSLRKKIKIKFLVASLKALTNFIGCSESRIGISLRDFLFSHWLIFFRIH